MAGHCGAKTTAGGKCKAPAMANGRCRVHGGATPKGSANAAKPGSIYSKFLTPEEQKTAGAMELGDLDDELRLTRIRLMRALAAETDVPELEEVVERDGAENVTARREEKFKRRDYSGLIDKLTARIESLERRRLELLLLKKQIDEAGDGDNASVEGFEIVSYGD